MKKNIFLFFMSALYTFIMIFLWNIICLSFLPETGMLDLRLSISSLFVVFFALKKRGSWLPWAILYVEFCQSLFTVASWGQHVIAGLVILLLAKLLRDFINVKHNFAVVVVVCGLLIVRYIVMSVLWAVKIDGFQHLMEMIMDYLPQSIIMGFVAIPLFKLFTMIWGQRSLDGDFDMRHV